MHCVHVLYCIILMLFGVSCGLHYSVAHSLLITHAHAPFTLFYFHTEMYLFGEEQRVAETSVARMPNRVNNMF